MTGGGDARVFRVLVCLLVGAWLVAAISSLDARHHWGDDWAQYAAQARALAEGTLQQELELAKFRNAASTEPFGPTVVPWGFPLVLAPAYALSQGDLLVMKIPGCIFYALFLLTLFVLFEQRISGVSRVLLVAIFALSPALFNFQNQLLTDIPFLFYSTFSLLLIDRCVLRRQFFAGPVFDLSLLGAAIALAALTRTVGFLLLPTVAVAQIMCWLPARHTGLVRHLLTRRSEGLIYAISCAGLLAADWMLPSVEVSASAQFGYLREAGIWELGSKVLERLQVYALLPSEFFVSHWASEPVARALAVLTLALAARGVVCHLRRDVVFVAYCALSMGVLILTDFFNGLRYLFPILPFLIYFAISGLVPKPAASSWMGWRSWPIAPACAGAVLVLFAAHQAMAFGEQARPTSDFSPFGKDGRAMLNYVTREIDQDSAVIFFKPRALTYLTGRRSIVVSRFDQVFDGRADFIVLTIQKVRDQLPVRAPFWQKRRADYEVVFQNRNYRVLDLRPGFAAQR